MTKLTFRELASKRITGFVNWHRNRRKHLFTDTLEKLLDDLETKSPDHLAITGDLVNLSLANEFAPARAWLEGLGVPGDVTLVPGNHDTYVRAALGFALVIGLGLFLTEIRLATRASKAA